MRICAPCLLDDHKSHVPDKRFCSKSDCECVIHPPLSEGFWATVDMSPGATVHFLLGDVEHMGTIALDGRSIVGVREVA